MAKTTAIRLTRNYRFIITSRQLHLNMGMRECAFRMEFSQDQIDITERNEYSMLFTLRKSHRKSYEKSRYASVRLQLLMQFMMAVFLPKIYIRVSLRKKWKD